jgi:hypothetical protein
VTFIYEYELCDQLIRNPSSELTSNFERYLKLTEVKVGSKTADLVFFDAKLKEIIAIELKVNKWKSALRQAMTYQLWATESYVALSRKHVNGALKNRRVFEECGVGIISIDGFTKVELKAKKSSYQNLQYLEMARTEINRRMSTGGKDQQ